MNLSRTWRVKPVPYFKQADGTVLYVEIGVEIDGYGAYWLSPAQIAHLESLAEKARRKEASDA